MLAFNYTSFISLVYQLHLLTNLFGYDAMCMISFSYCFTGLFSTSSSSIINVYLGESQEFGFMGC